MEESQPRWLRLTLVLILLLNGPQLLALSLFTRVNPPLLLVLRPPVAPQLRRQLRL
jgi:hypothetical protein